MFKEFIHFVKHGVWEENPRSGWVVRPFKISIYTVRGIGEHDIFINASALTYYTILSIVPIAALIFGFMKGFGFDDRLWAWIYEKFPGDKSFLDQYAHGFIDNLLVYTKGGPIAAVGMVVLFWSVVRVFTTVEQSFNKIWEVKKGRSIARQLSDYLAVVIVAPLLLISIAPIGTLIRQNLSWMAPWMVNALFSLVGLMVVWLLFAFVYWVMPNTRVKFKGALIAATIAGTAFWVFQQIYFAVQSSLSGNNAVYGAFAAIPLLLVWLQTSWAIVLVGAELSFAYQNIDRYELERQAVNMNINNKRKISVAAMAVIVKHFVEGLGPVSSEHIATELGLPVRSVRDVVYELEHSGLVVMVKPEHDQKTTLYIPARDVHELTVYDVVDGVENDHTSNLDVRSMPELHRVSELIDHASEATRKAGMMTKLTDLL